MTGYRLLYCYIDENKPQGLFLWACVLCSHHYIVPPYPLTTTFLQWFVLPLNRNGEFGKQFYFIRCKRKINKRHNKNTPTKWHCALYQSIDGYWQRVNHIKRCYLTWVIRTVSTPTHATGRVWFGGGLAVLLILLSARSNMRLLILFSNR